MKGTGYDSRDMVNLNDHNFGGLPRPSCSRLEGENQRIRIGICAMKKKVYSRPMTEILNRIDLQEFEIVIFDEHVILHEDVKQWPLCHALIAFFSTGFPLAKAKEYVALRRPFVVNDIHRQALLQDRRHVLKLMECHGVPVPEYVVVNRSSYSPSSIPVEVTAESDFKEFEDYIVVRGKVLNKPFVEKPVNGEDHNVYIYYPRSAGGGSCRLFRKRGGRSSEFYPDENRVRREGSYIYEAFLRTGGTDIKIYTIGAHYAHSEARKAPSIDGVVARNEEGFEIRFPVMLTAVEKEMAHTVVKATGQRICGFDVLRDSACSYVCDVNGWSFVKNNHKYYDDFAQILSSFCREAMGISKDCIFALPDEIQAAEKHESEDSDQDNTETGDGFIFPGDDHEELRCVIAVVRHGDRTPKQKLKFVLKEPEVISIFEKYGDIRQRSDMKLKSAVELGYVLNVIHNLMASAHFQSQNLVDHLLQTVSVLELHGTFKGINRKVQLKPISWDPETSKIVEVQFIVKWGGALTKRGRQEAEMLGKSFRRSLYPFDGLLRLHSTYRHDLKIYSSREGRVQVTAAAFVKGMLQLEGHLTPILASLVTKGNDIDMLLDFTDDASVVMDQVKKRLQSAMKSKSVSSDIVDNLTPTKASSTMRALEEMNFYPHGSMEKLLKHISAFVTQLCSCMSKQRGRFMPLRDSKTTDLGIANPMLLLSPKKGVNGDGYASSNSSTATDISTAPVDSQSFGGSVAASLGPSGAVNAEAHIVNEKNSTDLLMALSRWTKLRNELYDKKREAFDISKIPDIYDSARYDLLHNPSLLFLKPPSLQRVFEISRILAAVVVPQEYGITGNEKRKIGLRISRNLIAKIQNDLRNAIGSHGLKSFGESNSRVLPVPQSNGLSKSQSRLMFPIESVTSENASAKGTCHSMNASTATLSELGVLGLPTDSDAHHRLDKRHARSLGIKSHDRLVRTRLYFTSESHLHSLLNVIRYSTAKELGVNSSDIAFPSIDPEALKQLEEMEELNYLTHIVFRLYEIIPSRKGNGMRSDSTIRDTENPAGSDCPSEENARSQFSRRFRVHVSISPGVSVETGASKDEEKLDGSINFGSKVSKNEKFDVAVVPGKDGIEINLEPCKQHITLFKDIEYNRLDRSFSGAVNEEAADTGEF